MSAPQPCPVEDHGDDDVVAPLAALLASRQECARIAGRQALACALDIARYRRGHPLAAITPAEPGFHRINSAARAELMREVPAALATSDPARHALARERLAEALGSYMMDAVQ
jgi:hypothetical protein